MDNKKEIKLHQFKEKLELRGYARRTIGEYCDYVKLFMRYLEQEEGITSFDRVEPEHINGFHAHLRYTKGTNGKYMSLGSVRFRLFGLKTFYKIMYAEKLVSQNYAPLISLPREIRSVPSHIPSEKEMKKLLESVKPETPLRTRDRAILELLYATGIRNEELCGLYTGSIDFNEKTVVVKGKGSKERLVPLGEWVIPYLREYLLVSRPKLLSGRKDTDIFFVSKTGRKLTRRMLAQLVSRHRTKSGLTVRITPHSFRHACATHLLKHGADIRYVQELLGHERLSTTQIYTKVEISFLKKVHKRFHPRERHTHD